jgi:hypothetical protein
MDSPNFSEIFLIYLGLTQLVGGWGSLDGLRPSKLPQIHRQVRNFYYY